MKEINEEMQMRIFDLLEGNLSPAEKEALFKEIEQSKELQHEYTLMSKTYLEVDAVAFDNKAGLYRPKRGIVYFLPLQRYAAAAAVLLLAAGAWYFMKNDTATTPNVAVTLSPKPSDTIKTNAVKQTTETATYKTVHDKQKSTQSNFYTAPLIEFAPVESIQPEPIIAAFPIKIDTLAIAQMNPSIENIDTTSSASSDKPVVPISKKRSLSYKLLQNSRTMLANLQLPDVKFKTEKKANSNIPKVKMEIHAYKTDVIATLID